MNRTYVIVTKKIGRTRMPCGMMAAQVQHVTAKAIKAGFNINPDEASIILQFANEEKLHQLAADLLKKSVDFVAYYEQSKLFDGRKMTAIVIKPCLVCMVVENLKLWSCNC